MEDLSLYIRILWLGLGLAALVVGVQQTDHALDLWYCHAAVGYNHQQQLDECLATERSGE